MSVTGFGKIYTNILILALVDIDTLCGTDNTVVRNSLWTFVYLLHTGIGTYVEHVYTTCVFIILIILV